MPDEADIDAQNTIALLEAELRDVRANQETAEELLLQAAEFGQDLLLRNEALEQNLADTRRRRSSYNALVKEVEQLREAQRRSRLSDRSHLTDDTNLSKPPKTSRLRNRRRTSKFEELLQYNRSLEGDLSNLMENYRLLQKEQMERVDEEELESESESDDLCDGCVADGSDEDEGHFAQKFIEEDLHFLRNEEKRLSEIHGEKHELLEATLSGLEMRCASETNTVFELRAQLSNTEIVCEELHQSRIQLQEKVDSGEEHAAHIQEQSLAREEELRHMLDDERSKLSAAMMSDTSFMMDDVSTIASELSRRMLGEKTQHHLCPRRFRQTPQHPARSKNDTYCIVG